MLLLGSQEKGWPLGCLSRASPRAAYLQVLFSLCLFGTQTWLKRRKEKKNSSLVMYKSVSIPNPFYCFVFKSCSSKLKRWRQQMNGKTKLYAKSVNMKVGFVHTRQLHTHRTGNCLCKLAFGLCNKLLSITPSFYPLWSRGLGEGRWR